MIVEANNLDLRSITFTPSCDSILIISGRNVRESGVCSDRHNIYVFGGKPDDLSAHKFDVCQGVWESLPEMIRPRRCTGNLLLFF